MRPIKTLLALPIALSLAACPGKDKPVPVVQVDTTPVKLDSLKAAIPPAVPDTFTPVKVAKQRTRQPSIPKAPPPLQSVVEHESGFSRFCYQEFGQKTDPKLQGAVALIVTVGGAGVTNVKVADDNWSSKAGEEVNKCLLPRAKEAWRLSPGSVKPGDYVVQLQFRGT